MHLYFAEAQITVNLYVNLLHVCLRANKRWHGEKGCWFDKEQCSFSSLASKDSYVIKHRGFALQLLSGVYFGRVGRGGLCDLDCSSASILRNRRCRFRSDEESARKLLDCAPTTLLQSQKLGQGEDRSVVRDSFMGVKCALPFGIAAVVNCNLFLSPSEVIGMG